MTIQALRSILISLIVLLLPAVGLSVAQDTDGRHDARPGLPALKVVGNRLQTADGRVARLQGVNIPSLEWGQGEHLVESLQVAVTDWKANIVRLCLSQDRWFGHSPERRDGGAGYRRTVRAFVDRAAAARCYVILDLHWSDAGTWGSHIGQHKMPDEHSAEFWAAAAAAFAGDPGVLFGLYNEPYDVSWETWRNGGTVREDNMKTPGGRLEYRAPGMQKLLDVCRAAGARNVVVAGGLDWAYDLTGVASGYALDDPNGNGVIYDTHLYPMKKWYTHGTTKSQEWDRLVMSAGRKYPVLIGEFGDGKEGYANKVLEFADRNDLPWTAWSLHPGARPVLIKDWKYTPTDFGAVVKEALQSSAARR
jgi:hypothetical protein